MLDENDGLTSIGLINTLIEDTQPPENEDVEVIEDYTTSFRTSGINPVLGATLLTGWVKPGEIWQLNI